MMRIYTFYSSPDGSGNPFCGFVILSLSKDKITKRLQRTAGK